MMVLDSNAVEASEAKWPTTTTGMRPCEELGRAPGVGHGHGLGALADEEVRPGRRRVDGARHDGALQAEGLRAQRGLVRQRLVNRVEVVERAAQTLDEEEDERHHEQREDHEHAPAHLAPPGRRHGRTRVDLGRRRGGRGGVGGGVGHDRSPGTAAPSRSPAWTLAARSARSQRRRRRTRLTAYRNEPPSAAT